MKRVINSTYVYDGPVYRFGTNIGNFKVETEAPTIGRAKSNILYRIKQTIGLDRKAKIEIIDSRISEISNDNQKEIEDIKDTDENEQLVLFNM